MMDFFRRLFGGGQPASASGDSEDKIGLYFYIQPTGCKEVIQVRIDSRNDLSLADDNRTYFVIKTVRGTTYTCTRSAELRLSFDANRRLQNTEVIGGTLVDQAAYLAWLDSSGA
jgi:hypothetical protein